MTLVDNIRKPILAELQLYKDTFAETLSTENPMLMNINDYVIEKSGDRLRPILALLFAKLCGEINDITINGALSLELLYIASVIHDDVVDEVVERQGTASINSRWSNKIAILSGDYILSKSLGCGTRTDNLAILKSIANIGMELSDGELLKLASTKITSESEANYLKYITKKAALMFATCAEVGGLSVNANVDELSHLRKFGEYLGISFQLKHDIAHFASDLSGGKITYPLIYALQYCNSKEKSQILQWIYENEFSTQNVEIIREFTLENAGLASTQKIADDYKQRAIEELNGFEDNEVKQSLLLCAEYVAQ